jgi:hypothetical protein
MTTSVKRWQQHIEQIKQELLSPGFGDMRPGALSQQYNVCGKPGCRCKDPNNPKRHGPYYQLSYTHLGKSTTEFIKRERLAEVEQQLANYARFKQLTEQWVDLSLRIAKSRRTRPDR